MGTNLVSVNSVNMTLAIGESHVVADQYVRRYQESTKSAIEGILNMVNCCQFRSNTKESFSIVNHCSNMG